MKIGLVLPQGWLGEFADRPDDAAWARTLEIARRADERGFESLWAFDHLEPAPDALDGDNGGRTLAPDEIDAARSRGLAAREAAVMDPWVILTAVAQVTSRVRLGPLVLCAGFRHPSIVARMAGSLDLISGGRFEMALGSGWNRHEWEAFGFRFPDRRDRLAGLSDALEIVTRLLSGEAASHQGSVWSTAGARCRPAGVQRPRIPIIVGGNGARVTWRLAALHADELNLDGMTPAAVEAALPVIRGHCLDVGRDPATLRVSIHAGLYLHEPGGPRVRHLERFRSMGLARLMYYVPGCADSDDVIERFADDCEAAGIGIGAPA